MDTFRSYLENRDKEQLRRLGLKPGRFSIGKFPNYDYTIKPQGDDLRSSDGYAVVGDGAYLYDNEGDLRSDDETDVPATDHVSDDAFGYGGEQYEIDKEREEYLNRLRRDAQERVNLYSERFYKVAVARLALASEKARDFSILNALYNKYPSRNDWLVAADFIEEQGFRSGDVRAWARKVLK